MNKIYIVIGITFAGIIFLWINKNKETEMYQNMNDCRKAGDVCNNFETCCLNNKDIKCHNQDLLACKKFRIKCEVKCQKKKTDDNGKKFKNKDKTDMENCMNICKKVQSDCCQRLGK